MLTFGLAPISFNNTLTAIGSVEPRIAPTINKPERGMVLSNPKIDKKKPKITQHNNTPINAKHNMPAKFFLNKNKFELNPYSNINKGMKI